MKKKGIVIGVIVLVVAIISIYLVTSPEILGSMNHNYSEPTTTTSNISFAGETGDRIKFSFRSDVESGELDISLYDSKGNAVYEFDRATASETFFDLNNTDTYTLVAEYKEFVGKYRIKAYKANSWTMYRV